MKTTGTTPKNLPFGVTSRKNDEHRRNYSQAQVHYIIVVLISVDKLLHEPYCCGVIMMCNTMWDTKKLVICLNVVHGGKDIKTVETLWLDVDLFIYYI